MNAGHTESSGSYLADLEDEMASTGLLALCRKGVVICSFLLPFVWPFLPDNYNS
jgi:hypothetical protein